MHELRVADERRRAAAAARARAERGPPRRWSCGWSRRWSPPRSSASARPTRASEQAVGRLRARPARPARCATASDDRRARRRARARPRRRRGRRRRPRARRTSPAEEGWRERVLAVAERGARAAVPGARRRARPGAPDRPGAEVVVLVPGADDAGAPSASPSASLRELQAALPGHTFARRAQPRWRADPADLYRAGNEALLAANVAEGEPSEPAPRARVRGDGRLPAAAVGDERGPRPSCSASTPRPSSRSSPTTSSTRPTSSQTRRGVPRRRRQRRRHRAAAVHPPPHDPLPARARARALRARRRLHRRPREAQPRPEGDARARHRRPRRAGHRGGRAAAAASPRPLALIAQRDCSPGRRDR